MNEKPDQRIFERGNAISEEVIGAAIAIHRHFGPGLLESAYESCLCHELFLRNIRFQRQLILPLTYKGINVDSGYKIDILVEGIVVVELKAVERLAGVHEAQLLTYLKLSNRYQGLLLNFNQLRLCDGIKRVINPAAGNNLELLNL
jgi:GxxExxY protein